MRGTGQNLALTRAEIVAIRKAVVQTVDAEIVGRRMCYIDRDVPRKARRYQYHTVTDPQAAQVIDIGGKIPRDSVKLTPTSAKIVKLAQGFTISKEDIDGKHIKTVNAVRAARTISRLENDLIWNSADEPDVDGVIDDAGNTNAGTAAWSGGVGVAYPVEDVATGIANLVVDGFKPPFDLVLEATNFGEAEFRQASLNRTELEIIAAMKNINNIYTDPELPHGTAVLIKPGMENVVLGQAYDIEQLGPFFDEDNEVWNFNLTMRETVAILQPNSINTVTGL